MSQCWFKAKECGWGTGLPISWEGWVATLCLVLVISASAYINLLKDKNIRPAFRDWLRFALDTIILTALFCLVLQNKIAGGLQWR